LRDFIAPGLAGDAVGQRDKVAQLRTTLQAYFGDFRLLKQKKVKIEEG
jgi:hypothetical protein